MVKLEEKKGISKEQTFHCRQCFTLAAIDLQVKGKKSKASDREVIPTKLVDADNSLIVFDFWGPINVRADFGMLADVAKNGQRSKYPTANFGLKATLGESKQTILITYRCCRDIGD